MHYLFNLKKTIFTLVLSLLFIVNNATALSCGDSIASNIVMTHDLNCTSGYQALEVVADNITIDMNGHKISGTRSLSGISVSNHYNVTIKNGVISGFWVGVNSFKSYLVDIDSVTFYNLGTGVIFNSTNKSMVSHSNFYYIDSQGVYISRNEFGTTANDNVIFKNQFYKNRIGIEACGSNSDNNQISDNFIWKTTDYGISLSSSHSNLITYNTVLETNSTAIRVYNSSLNTIKSNSLRQGGAGLSLIAGGDNSCSASPSKATYKNSFSGNHAIDFNTGINLGFGSTPSAQVFNNSLNNNKVYNDNIGIYFKQDAHYNDAKYNAFYGTATPVIDNGMGNTF
jgi:parallel beta-helix repeat protein